MQTLRRTPLYDRHVAAGARIVPSRAGRCPSSTRASSRSIARCETDSGVFDVSHMGEIEVEGPTARDVLQAPLSNDIDKLVAGQRSTRC